jgi:hypothetical protein
VNLWVVAAEAEIALVKPAASRDSTQQGQMDRKVEVEDLIRNMLRQSPYGQAIYAWNQKVQEDMHQLQLHAQLASNTEPGRR